MQILLNNIKRIIENCYKIDSGIDDVNRFLVKEDTYKRLEDQIITKVDYNDDARVFLVEDGEDIKLGLYFSEDFKKRFEENNPRVKGISDSNLNLFSILVEEVDHFVMLAYSAHNEKPVSLLELELQANITKYLVLRALVALQQNTFPKIRPHAVQSLKELVFECKYDEQDPDIQFRYENAARLAKAFISYFESIKNPYRKTTKLREFYRLSPQSKLDGIRKETGVSLI